MKTWKQKENNKSHIETEAKSSTKMANGTNGTNGADKLHYPYVPIFFHWYLSILFACELWYRFLMWLRMVMPNLTNTHQMNKNNTKIQQLSVKCVAIFACISTIMMTTTTTPMIIMFCNARINARTLSHQNTCSLCVLCKSLALTIKLQAIVVFRPETKSEHLDNKLNGSI